VNAGERWQIRFFTIWTGQAFSLVGSSLVRFALIWWLTEHTGSATTLAVATLMSQLPIIVLGPFAGALIDRWSRRWVMVVSDGLIALFTAFLAYLYWIDRAQTWHVYAILFLRSLGGAFQDPAMRASTSLMAPKDQLARVAGMNQTMQGVVSIVSPPLGALLLEVLSIEGTLAIDLITALLAIGPLLFMGVPQPEATARQSSERSVLREIGEGFRYAWNWRGMFLFMSSTALIRFFLAPAFSFTPLLVTQHFGGGALQLGWISSAFGAGLISGGLVLSAWGGFKRRMVTLLVGVLGFGLGTMTVGLAPSWAFWLALVAGFWRGAMVPIFSGAMDAIYQSSIPPEMQGRFFTLNNSVGMVMSPLGLAIAGPVGDVLGVRAIFVLGGVACMLVPLIWVLTPIIWHLEEDPNRHGDLGDRSASVEETD
jgi:DHA3 family macrolide efflux protein-like MFS transporter